MAGIWEKLKPKAPGDQERINVHFIIAGLRGYHANTVDSSVGFTRLQVRNGLNELLTRKGFSELSVAEEADLSAIADTLDAQNNNTSKIIYLGLVETIMIAAEVGLIGETKFRNDLGI